MGIKQISDFISSASLLNSEILLTHAYSELKFLQMNIYILFTTGGDAK